MLKTDVTTVLVQGVNDKTRLIYQAPSPVTVKLFLETGGPCAIGIQVNQLFPIGTKGRLLPTRQEVEFTMATGQMLYIASDTSERVAMTVQDVAYLPEIFDLMRLAMGALGTTQPGGEFCAPKRG